MGRGAYEQRRESSWWYGTGGGDLSGALDGRVLGAQVRGQVAKRFGALAVQPERLVHRDLQVQPVLDHSEVDGAEHSGEARAVRVAAGAELARDLLGQRARRPRRERVGAGECAREVHAARGLLEQLAHRETRGGERAVVGAEREVHLEHDVLALHVLQQEVVHFDRIERAEVVLVSAHIFKV